MTINSTVRLSRDQVSCDLNGEAAILNLKTGKYYGLDPVGATVWKLMEQPCTIESIREAMRQRYDVDAERCQSDLLELLEKLSAKGLIEVTG
jgi:hypothetical protein